MDKKIITLSTGLMLSTALAFSAINPTDLKVVDPATFAGGNCYIVADANGNGELDTNDVMLSVVANADGKTINGSLTNKLSEISFDTKGIVFNVGAVASQTEADVTLYTLYSNDAKSYLAIEGVTPETNIESAAKSTNRFYKFMKGSDGSALKNYKETEGKASYLSATNGYKLYFGLSSSGTGEVAGKTEFAGSKIFLCEAESSISDNDLNEFFNKKGFNLAVNYDEKEGKLAENIFGGDSRIYAFELTTDYKFSDENVNGKDLIIPQGMYFFTNRVLIDAAGKVEASNIDWLASEFITVSPRETVETTVSDRVDGQGFKLVPLKGSEFLFGDNTSEYKVADNPIQNACFTVTSNQIGEYPFAIGLKEFYYQAKKSDKDTDKLSVAKDDKAVSLYVIALTADNTQYLTTVPTSAKAIFKFSDSALKDGKELLKTTKEAAVYNLQFVAGKSEAQEKLVGKYLTVATNGSDFEWVAKPYDITKVENPDFQYTITRVIDEDKEDDVEKYTIIEFTNRETNESFMAKLFPEPSYGENCYSLAFVNEKGETQVNIVVDALKVNNNNYAVGYEELKDGSKATNVEVSEDVIIKLIPAKVDEYAGFLNVDDGTVRTIRFARDKFDTSYQWYANVEDKGTTTVDYEFSDEFVEDNYDAAQFVLVKSEKPSTIARTFVYNNTTTEDVDDVPNGDKLSAYTYQLMYVADGTTSKFGLKGIGYRDKLQLEASNYTKYYIRENADGSVSFFDKDDSYTFNGMAVAPAIETNAVQAKIEKVNNKVEIKYLTNNETYRLLYNATSNEDDLKAYLEAEAPVFSWVGENGHVTLRNNTTGVTGNYISMNDSREGILVSNDADVFYLHATDEKAVVPSFFISKGKGEGSNAASERMFMFNPTDSVSYPVNMTFDPNYQLTTDKTKAIFKAGTLNEDYTKLNTWIKGENRDVAKEADNNGVWGGLDRFKFQIVETADHDGNYNVRQTNTDEGTVYLASTNEKLYFTGDKALAMAINVESVEAPTSNESVSVSEVVVVAQNGSVVVKNAAGKNVVVSTILGQVVANEVLTSDNATINVPAGIVVVAVEGESFKVNVK